MFSPEFSLLVLSCRRGDGDERTIAEAKRIILGGGIDWERLYHRADLLSVRPQMAKLLSVLPYEAVPDSLRTRINKAYLDTVHDQISYAAEFLKIQSLLLADGIPALPFKGFWLAHEYYGSLGDREASDVDLFTEFRNLERIGQIMLENGYVVEKQMAEYTLEELAGRAGEYNFDKIEDGRIVSHIEYHWRMSSPVYGLGISFEDLSSQIVAGRLQENDLQVFTPSADFLLAVMHHGGKDPFNELKYVLDFACLLRRQGEIDWEWVLEMARRFRSERLVYVAVGLAHELLGAPLPAALKVAALSPVIRRLTFNRIRFMANALEYWHPWIFINDWLFRIRSRSGFRLKWQLAWYITGKIIDQMRVKLIGR
jgi:hypothetical protein